MTVTDSANVKISLKSVQRITEWAERYEAMMEEAASTPDDTGVALNYARATGMGIGALRTIIMEARYVSKLLEEVEA